MISINGSPYAEEGHLLINRRSKETQFRAIFSGLDETGQDRLLDTARALSFAARTREGQPGEAARRRTPRPEEK